MSYLSAVVISTSQNKHNFPYISCIGTPQLSSQASTSSSAAVTVKEVKDSNNHSKDVNDNCLSLQSNVVSAPKKSQPAHHILKDASLDDEELAMEASEITSAGPQPRPRKQKVWWT